MPIALLCGNCNAKLNAPDAAAGKKVKCPKCATILQIPTPEPEPSFEVVDDEPAPSPKASVKKAPAKPKPVVLDEDDEDEASRPPAKKKAVIVEDDDEDEEPTPKKKKGKKKPAAKSSSLPFLIGGGVLGLALVGFLVYWFVIRTPEVAKGPDTNNPPADQKNPQPPKPPAPKEEWKEVAGDGFVVQIPKTYTNFGVERSPEAQELEAMGGREWTTPKNISANFGVTRLPLPSKPNRTDAELEEVAKQSYARLRHKSEAPPKFLSAKVVPVTGGQGVELSIEGGTENKFTYLTSVIIRANACYVLRASAGAVYTLNGVTSCDNEPAVRFFESFRFADGPKQPTPGGNTGTNPGAARKWVPTDLTAHGFPIVLDLPPNANIKTDGDTKRPLLYVNPSIMSTIGVQQAGGPLDSIDAWKRQDVNLYKDLKFTEDKPERYFGGCLDEDIGKGMMTYMMCVEVEAAGKKYLIHATVNSRSRQEADFFWETLKSAKAK